MEKYTKIPADTFQHLAVNAGILLSDFDPETGTVVQSNMLGATSGGVNFNATVDYIDYGEDIDNCPKNTKELKRIDNRTVNVSGSYVAMTTVSARRMMAHADISGNKITPRDTIDIENDFSDVWIVGDYGDKNTGSGAGFIAIHLIDCLSTGGFQLQTADKEKGKFAFEYTAHYSLDAQDTPPYEIYIKEGTTAPGITVSRSQVTVPVGEKVKLSATTYPAAATVTWASNDTDKATVTDGEVTGVAAGYAVVTASITENTVTYTDICTVTVVAAS